MPYQTTVYNFQDALVAAYTNIIASMLGTLPNLLGAIVILLLGFIVANWTKVIIKKSLELINLSKMLKGLGVSGFLKKADIQSKVEEVFGEVFRWLVILVFFIAAVNILGLVTVSAFLTSILDYVPKVISAALVLAAGVLVAGWVESLVKGAFGSISLGTGRLLGKISSYTIVVFTTLAAISELGIAAQFINTLFIGFVAMLSLGLGLAFGLGAKDLVKEALSEWYKELKKDLK